MEPVIKLHWIAIVLLSSIPSNQGKLMAIKVGNFFYTQSYCYDYKKSRPFIQMLNVTVVCCIRFLFFKANCTTLEFLLLGATPGSTTESVVAFNDEHSGPVAIPGGLPYSNGNTTSTFVSCYTGRDMIHTSIYGRYFSMPDFRDPV